MKMLSLLILSLAISAQAQWITIASPGQKVTMPIGSYIRYGNTTTNTWSAVKPFTSVQSFIVGPGEFPSAPSNANSLQAYQEPVALPGFVIAGVPYILQETLLVNTPPVTQPVLSGTYQLNAVCTVNLTTMSVVCK